MSKLKIHVYYTQKTIPSLENKFDEAYTTVTTAPQTMKIERPTYHFDPNKVRNTMLMSGDVGQEIVYTDTTDFVIKTISILLTSYLDRYRAAPIPYPFPIPTIQSPLSVIDPLTSLSRYSPPQHTLPNSQPSLPMPKQPSDGDSNGLSDSSPGNLSPLAGKENPVLD